MKKKGKVVSLLTGSLLLISLSFAGSVGATPPHQIGDGNGGSPPPKCNSQGQCPIGP